MNTNEVLNKLKAEIERRRKQKIEANDKIAKGEIFTDAEDEFNSSLARYGNRLVYQELFEIFCFIESLQQEQPEEYESLPKVRGWVARFADGSLGISKEKPFYYEADGKTYISGYETVFIDKSLFPELHWLDEPVEVELLVRRV